MCAAHSAIPCIFATNSLYQRENSAFKQCLLTKFMQVRVGNVKENKILIKDVRTP